MPAVFTARCLLSARSESFGSWRLRSHVLCLGVHKTVRLSTMNEPRRVVCLSPGDEAAGESYGWHPVTNAGSTSGYQPATHFGLMMSCEAHSGPARHGRRQLRALELSVLRSIRVASPDLRSPIWCALPVVGPARCSQVSKS